MNIPPKKLTLASQHILERLTERGLPIITPFEFNHLVWNMYKSADRKKLRLPHDTPTERDYTRLRTNLRNAGATSLDPDYGRNIIRILSIPDLYADDIVCLADPTVRVAYLSAMRRWGLTDRRPLALMLARPNRAAATEKLKTQMTETLDEGESNPDNLKVITHPETVRRRQLAVHEVKSEGAFILERGALTQVTRVSTIGQTFLDMLQKPELCGGMNHVLDVWEEHASIWLEEIVQSVDTATSNLVKSRAGYIIEERLNLSHPLLAAWKSQCQRGGSRKLDPGKDFAPTFSETWTISINV